MIGALLKITDGIDVLPLLAEIDAQPDLWDQHRDRKDAVGSPHAQMSDIWIRYRAREELTCRQAFIEPHKQVFYPAWDALPALRPVMEHLLAVEHPIQLGGILITRIPPGGKIAWHHDRGSWHAEYFRRKIYVPLRANDQCVNYCGDDRAVMRPGEAWFFDNLIPHAVENNGATERITLIVCMRSAA